MNSQSNYHKGMIGNEQPKKTLQIFFDQLKSDGQIAESVPFLIVSGPQYTGKKEAIEKHIHSLLGEYAPQDYRAMYDCTDILGKNHSLKVSVKEKNHSIIDDEDNVYLNRGAREIANWLSRSSASGRKVVFLENIERMTTHAANALLKSLEEPLPGRLIVATTKNYNLLLDTIISRGMIIRFDHIPFDLVEKYAKEEFEDVAEPLRRFAVAYSAGKPGLVERILTRDESIHNMSTCFNACVDFYKEGGSLVKHYHRLKQWVKEFGNLESLLDGLLFSLDPLENGEVIRHLIGAKKIAQTPVNEDNLLFHLSLASEGIDDTLT